MIVLSFECTFVLLIYGFIVVHMGDMTYIFGASYIYFSHISRFETELTLSPKVGGGNLQWKFFSSSLCNIDNINYTSNYNVILSHVNLFRVPFAEEEKLDGLLTTPLKQNTIPTIPGEVTRHLT